MRASAPRRPGGAGIPGVAGIAARSAGDPALLVRIQATAGTLMSIGGMQAPRRRARWMPTRRGPQASSPRLLDIDFDRLLRDTRSLLEAILDRNRATAPECDPDRVLAELELVRRALRARHRLSAGGAVSVRDLAALAGVSTRRIRQAIATREGRGAVDNAAAAEFMQAYTFTEEEMLGFLEDMRDESRESRRAYERARYHARRRASPHR